MEIKEMKDFFNAQIIIMKYTDEIGTSSPYVDSLKTALRYMEKLERENAKKNMEDLKLDQILK